MEPDHEYARHERDAHGLQPIEYDYTEEFEGWALIFCAVLFLLFGFIIGFCVGLLF